MCHKYGTNDTNTAQDTELKHRLKFREKLFFSLSRYRPLLEQSHRIDTRVNGEDYADRHLVSLHKFLHFGSLNLCTADAESVDCYAEDLARRCESRLVDTTDTRAYADTITSFLADRSIHVECTFRSFEKFTRAGWWRKKIYQRLREAQAQLFRACGQVHKQGDIYIDGESAAHHRLLCAQTRAYLESTLIENNHGQQFTLAEIADKSTSNPVNRRTEMMVELRGYSEWAQSQGEPAIFISLTTPSRMHRSFESGYPNPKYDGTSPAAAQKYLNQVWQRVRAQLKRDGISFYGMRVAEPHHDGTPHWHLLLFTHASNQASLIDTISTHALKVDGTEPGADTHRVQFTYCDESKGDPVGYMAKYVSKNVDGFGIETDQYDKPMVEANERIRAWASIYRIRQFQFFGGPSITVWRTLRKLNSSLSGRFEEIRIAADEGDYCRFIELMGGMCVPRQDRPIQLESIPANVDPSTGEIRDLDEDLEKLRRYIRMDDVLLPCSFFEWKLIPKKTLPVDFDHPAAGAARGLDDQPGADEGPLGLVSITVRSTESKYLLPNRNQDPE